MAFTNIPPNLQDIFYSITDRIAKLESAPNMPMVYAQSAQSTAYSAQYDSTQALWAAQLANTQATTAIALAGTKNTVFYSGTAPTANAVNDQWINTAQGNKLYIWNGSAWVSVQDTAIAAAQSAATAAQTTADGKNKIYRQGTTPTGTFSVGDLWFNTSSDNQMSRWDGTTWVPTTLGTNALANFSANKITSGTIDASVVNVSNINAGNISTGTLAADRIASASITGTKIAAGTITASNIATGTITATQIAAGTITATQISSSYAYVGQINATQINANTGTFTGGISASSGNIGGFNIVSSTYLQYGTTYIWGNSTSSTYSFQDTSRGIYVKDILTSGTGASGYGVATGSLYSSGLVNIGGNLFLSGNVTSDFNLSSSSEIRVPYAYSTTTSNAATVWISSTGQLRRSTASSERYKTDIVNLTDVSELDPTALYSLPVRAFKFKNEFISSNDDRADVLIPGFIAEEVDAIYPIATDYLNGAETWNDRMIIPAMLALIQEQNNRIKILEGN